MPASSLWTPGGEVPLKQKGIIQINRQELQLLSLLHEFAVKHQVNIFCKKCEKAITGQNTGQELHPSVACQCREWRYSGPR